MAHGQIRLSNMGGADPFSVVHICPFNGDLLTINGVDQTVPAGNLSVSGGVQANLSSCFIDKVGAQTLAPNMLYYVYAWMDGCTMRLDFSTHTQVQLSDGTWGKSTDNTCALVGILFTDANSQTHGGAARQTVCSWFNRLRYYLVQNLINASTTSVNTPTSVAPAQYLEWVQFSDDIANPSLVGFGSHSAASQSIRVGIGINSPLAFNGISSFSAVPGLTPTLPLFAKALNPGGDGHFVAYTLATGTAPGTSTIAQALLIIENMGV